MPTKRSSTTKQSQAGPEVGAGIVAPDATVQFAQGARSNIIDLNGPVIYAVHVQLIFWGTAWSGTQTVNAISSAVSNILAGPYMTDLAQYRDIGRGALVGQYLATATNPPSVFNNQDVSNLITGLLNNGILPTPSQDDQILYVVVMPTGVTYTPPPSGGFPDIGQHTYFDYANSSNPSNIQRVHYAWITNDGTLYYASVFSHELAEACSDPEGDAFQIMPYSTNSWNEISDSDCGCRSQSSTLTIAGNSFQVQKYWSESARACVAPTTAPCVIYGRNTGGGLMWYGHEGYLDGTVQWAGDHNGAAVGSGWATYDKVFSGGAGVIYGIKPNGDLMWYRHKGYLDGTVNWVHSYGVKVGSGWDQYNKVFSGGAGVIYGIKPNGDLMWHRHPGYLGNCVQLISGNDNKVGSGWNQYDKVFSGGAGVIYGIKPDGDLMWYRHLGGGKWASGQGNKVGNGWGTFTKVFSGGAGVVYGIKLNGDLMWYRHLGYVDGSDKWDHGPVKVGNGWGSFTEVLASADS